MKTIILQSDNNTDLDLLIALAHRLGVYCSVASPIPLTAEEEEDDLDILLEGLGLEDELVGISLDDFEDLPLYNTAYIPDFTNAQKYFGAWEDDEDETLEELLNMLTP